MMEMIKIGGLETFSAVDFPNQIAAVVFMQGCPWRCPFCYNTNLQGTEGPDEVDWNKFIEFLKKRKGILDAVVFSGGEPLMQDGLQKAMTEVKELGYIIGMHTGGYRPKHLAEVLPLVSWVGFDIKAPFAEEHYDRATGSKGHLPKVLQSLDLLLDNGIDFECRTTCDPRILEIADIYTIADELKAKGVKKYFLQKYRPVPSDKVTTDAECSKFFNDEGLLEYLRKTFTVFDTRM